MGHYASEMGYERREWYDGTGFTSVTGMGGALVACRTCRVVFWGNYDKDFLLQHQESCA